MDDAEKRQADEIRKAYSAVFETAAGKRVLFDVLELCGVYRSGFCGENTNGTHFMLGLQEAGKRVIGRLDEVDPRLYPALLLDIADMKAMEKEAAMAAAGEEEDDDAETDS